MAWGWNPPPMGIRVKGYAYPASIGFLIKSDFFRQGMTFSVDYLFFSLQTRWGMEGIYWTGDTLARTGNESWEKYEHFEKKSHDFPVYLFSFRTMLLINLHIIYIHVLRTVVLTSQIVTRSKWGSQTEPFWYLKQCSTNLSRGVTWSLNDTNLVFQYFILV